MRRDLVLTALIFAVIGFVGGYVYTRQAKQAAPQTAPLLGEQPSAEEAMGLPPGHPPMDVSRQIVALRQQAEQNPEDAGAALRLAEFLFEIGRCQEAIPWYERALAREPKNLDARVALASCLADTNQPDAAIEQLNAVLALKPNEPHALYHLALTLLRGKQDRAGAERVRQQLRQVNPNFPGLEELDRLLGASPRTSARSTGSGSP
ncbi:MAG: tetratricopeptide repeat protein [Acidobacteria bacterium]|nr:tetratricopeptide repeat protein [Acidobacteriota bacterium]